MGLSKAGIGLIAVLANSQHNIGRHTGLKSAVAVTCENIDVACLVHCATGRTPGSRVKPGMTLSFEQEAPNPDYSLGGRFRVGERSLTY